MLKRETEAITGKREKERIRSVRRKRYVLVCGWGGQKHNFAARETGIKAVCLGISGNRANLMAAVS